MLRNPKQYIHKFVEKQNQFRFITAITLKRNIYKILNGIKNCRTINNFLNVILRLFLKNKQVLFNFCGVRGLRMRLTVTYDASFRFLSNKVKNINYILDNIPKSVLFFSFLSKVYTILYWPVFAQMANFNRSWVHWPLILLNTI